MLARAQLCDDASMQTTCIEQFKAMLQYANSCFCIEEYFFCARKGQTENNFLMLFFNQFYIYFVIFSSLVIFFKKGRMCLDKVECHEDLMEEVAKKSDEKIIKVNQNDLHE